MWKLSSIIIILAVQSRYVVPQSFDRLVRTLIHIIHNDAEADAYTFIKHLICGVLCYDNGAAVNTLFYYAAESEIG